VEVGGQSGMGREPEVVNEREDVGEGPGAPAARGYAGDEFVNDEAEGIDVGDGGGRFAADLLGAGVVDAEGAV